MTKCTNNNFNNWKNIACKFTWQPNGYKIEFDEAQIGSTRDLNIEP